MRHTGASGLGAGDGLPSKSDRTCCDMDAKGRGSSIWGVLETSLEAILGPGLSVKRDMDAIYPGSKSRRPGSVCGSVCGVSLKVRVKKGAT